MLSTKIEIIRGRRWYISNESPVYAQHGTPTGERTESLSGASLPWEVSFPSIDAAMAYTLAYSKTVGFKCIFRDTRKVSTCFTCKA